MGALKKVLVECTSMGPSGTEPKPLSEEDKAFLNNALSAYAPKKKGEHMFHKSFEVLKELWERDDVLFDPKHSQALDGLANCTENFDTANDFINLGGLTVCYNLLVSTKAEVLLVVCDILANVAQNNEVFAKHPQCFPLLKYLLVKLKLQPTLGPKIQAKLLYAVNSITAADEVVVKRILPDEHVGFKDVLDLMISITDLKVVHRLRRFLVKLLAVNFDLPVVTAFCNKLFKGWINDITEGKVLEGDRTLADLELLFAKLEFVYDDIWLRGFALESSGFSHHNIYDDIRQFYRLFNKKIDPKHRPAAEKELWNKIFTIQKGFMSKVVFLEYPDPNGDERAYPALLEYTIEVNRNHVASTSDEDD